MRNIVQIFLNRVVSNCHYKGRYGSDLHHCYFLLGKCAHFESFTQLCLPRGKTNQFLLGELSNGHKASCKIVVMVSC